MINWGGWRQSQPSFAHSPDEDAYAGVAKAWVTSDPAHANAWIGQLPPGAKVAEAAVARELGISRAPVREAARLLEQQGLLVASPRRGFFVRKLEAADIDEIYDLRICVECHAGVLAVKNLSRPTFGRTSTASRNCCSIRQRATTRSSMRPPATSPMPVASGSARW